MLLLAVLHPAKRLARLVERAIEIGLEPLVEAHDEKELERALATRARIIGLNNRDLRTLDVDTERAVRLRALVPEDRLVVGESGVRDAATVAAWRAVGFDAALVGEALVRSADPAAAVRAFVSAGHPPRDPANVAAAPFVKICGVTDADGILAAIRAGADAIGLNLVPGTPRALSLDEAIELRRVARALAPASGTPQIVAITADAGEERIREIVAALDPDAVQLSGREQPASIAAVGRPAWKVIHLPREEPSDITTAATSIVALGREFLDAGAARLLLDTAGGPHPGGTGTRAAPSLAAAVAREIPVVLAGGLNPVSVGDAIRATPAVGVDVASGVERPREGDERPRKDPLRVALFVKRARAARVDRPNLVVRPTPVHPRPARGRRRRPMGHRARVRRTLRPRDPHVGASPTRGGVRRASPRPAVLVGPARAAPALRRPPHGPLSGGSPGVRDARAGNRVGGRTRLPHRLRIHLKREDLAHTGAHKINNALGQALLTRRLGKTRVIAETGAGQHGVATATACALLGLPCVVYMGAEDIERQQPNVLRMRALGTEVRPVTSGSATLKDAINEAMRDWVTNVETTHYVLGSAMGPHPYPTIVRDLQRRIGDEAAAQFAEVEGRLPDLALACVGGGSNAIGLLDRFIGEPSVRIAVAEAAGDGVATGRHAAALAGGTPGILHGARSMMLQDRDGQVDRGPLGIGRARLPRRRAADRGARGRGPAGNLRGDRRRGVRGDALAGPNRGDPAGPRIGPRARDAAADPGRHGRRGRRLAGGGRRR